MTETLSIIEDRPCACGHFYGNHAFDNHAAAEGLCVHIDCPCRRYTPAVPIEYSQELIDQLQLLGGRWGQVAVAEAAASLMLPGWTPGGAGEVSA